MLKTPHSRPRRVAQERERRGGAPLSLESVPEVAAELKAPEPKERKFEDVVEPAKQAAILGLVCGGVQTMAGEWMSEEWR